MRATVAVLNGPDGMTGSSRDRRLPLVIFALEGQRYALPLSAVERVLPMVEIAPLPAAPPIILGVINLRGRVVPVVDLRRRFCLPPRDYGLEGRLLVVQTPSRSLVLPVDDVEGLRELAPEAVQPVETAVPGLEQLAGVAALEGGLLYIQDLEACLTGNEERELADALREAAP